MLLLVFSKTSVLHIVQLLISDQLPNLLPLNSRVSNLLCKEMEQAIVMLLRAL